MPGTLKKLMLATLFLMLAMTPKSPVNAAELLDVLSAQMQRSLEKLGQAGAAPLYNLEYEVTEERTCEILASNGGLEAPRSSHRRYLDVDVRVGNMALDNTHEIRGGNWRDNYTPRRSWIFP